MLCDSSWIAICGFPILPALFLVAYGTSQVALVVKNQPAMQEQQETWVQSLGQEDPLEEGLATHSSVLPWRISMDRGAWWATVHGATELNTAEGTSRVCTLHRS